MAEFPPLEAAVTSVADLPLRRLGRPIGRDELLRALLLRLRQSQQLVLHGAAGTGVTTVAATIANVYLQQHDCPVLWLNIDNPPLVELIVRIARAYGEYDISNADNPLTGAAAVKALLSEKQPLLVLDGEIDSRVLALFVKRCAADLCHWWSPARRRWPMAIGAISRLATWRRATPSASSSRKPASRMRKTMSPSRSSPRNSSMQAFPLALTARSMIIARQSTADFSDTLAEALDSHEDQAAMAALSISFGGLNERLRDLLLFLCATTRGEASVAFLNLLSGIATESIDMSMTILSRLFLVERFQRLGQAYYRLHPLARDFLRDWALERDRLDGLRVDIVDTTRDYLDVHQGTDDFFMRLMLEMENLIATTEWAAQNDEEPSWRLISPKRSPQSKPSSKKLVSVTS